ncbi:hypothetical protein BJ508DRAFT_416954 [Ascobolus immersus RN42]|uniref:Uncharacterized protein n=1 Tax=Ascobolus immersus RN42 TaxID=1160509 RepID=A0A3N4I7E2_ASCIM|nr:hypothetical protein BJ508DRAFT_416954 [Ascobolus immersus RN42]
MGTPTLPTERYFYSTAVTGTIGRIEIDRSALLRLGILLRELYLRKSEEAGRENSIGPLYPSYSNISASGNAIQHNGDVVTYNEAHHSHTHTTTPLDIRAVIFTMAGTFSLGRSSCLLFDIGCVHPNQPTITPATTKSTGTTIIPTSTPKAGIQNLMHNIPASSFSHSHPSSRRSPRWSIWNLFTTALHTADVVNITATRTIQAPNPSPQRALSSPSHASLNLPTDTTTAERTTDSTRGIIRKLPRSWELVIPGLQLGNWRVSIDSDNDRIVVKIVDIYEEIGV